MVPEKAYIYGLFDPRCPDVIWYVGKTNNHRTRLQYHRKDALCVERPTPVQKWIRRLHAEGVKIGLRLLADCPFSEWKFKEREMVALYRTKNLLLLNKLDGGNGTAIKGRKEFCDNCGAKRVILYPSDGTLRCPICRPKQRRTYEQRWAQENSAHLQQYKADWYAENQQHCRTKSSKNYYNRKTQGICHYCNSPSRPDKVTCIQHAHRRHT
jgi:uncharacterized Zn finger protein (UPF0148 family)